jgi:WD40 repeat protein
MRLQVTSAAFKHADFVTGCGFVGSDLYTCSDDKTVRKINADGEDGGQVGETLKSYPTDMHWFPSASKKQQSDTFACGCSDGTFLLVFRNGRAEKPIQAHQVTLVQNLAIRVPQLPRPRSSPRALPERYTPSRVNLRPHADSCTHHPDTAARMQGAVICIRWNNEGTAIATGGEDGVIKIWSCPILMVYQRRFRALHRQRTRSNQPAATVGEGAAWRVGFHEG